jgi:hypothetical protein
VKRNNAFAPFAARLMFAHVLAAQGSWHLRVKRYVNGIVTFVNLASRAGFWRRMVVAVLGELPFVAVAFTSRLVASAD